MEHFAGARMQQGRTITGL